MTWSPEMELLDQLMGCDEQLCLIGKVFDGDLERAGKVLTIYVKKGIVLITRAPDRPDTVVPERELPLVLGDEDNWQWREEGEPAYWVHLTDKGLEAFESGPDAWERI